MLFFKKQVVFKGLIFTLFTMKKRTKIVATIGPATQSYDMLKQLGEAGVNVFRLNFSHGDHEVHKKTIDRIKQLNQDTNNHYAIMVDTKGPEIRTGDLEKILELKKGNQITLTIDHVTYEETQKIKINYEKFINDVEVGETILIDNGVINLKVLEKKGNDILCEVLDGGPMSSRRHVNLPGKDISLPSITEKDWEDIAFAVEQNADFIALSFIRGPEEILRIREFLQEKNANIRLITKVETLKATEHIDDLFEVSDGIMVARGDLGAEIPFEQVPIVQWEIAQKGAKYKKPVIVATHMLESMIKEPIPTRAEITDVFTATWQRNDAVMLSGETSVGAYPIKTVESMHKIAKETERAYMKKRSIRKIEVFNEKEAFCQNATDVVQSLKDVAFIMVITKTGRTSKLLSSFRPNTPIYAFTEDAAVCRCMSLLWGTKGFEIKLDQDPEVTIKNAMKTLVEYCPKYKNRRFVLLSDVLVDGKMIEALQIRTLE